MTFTALTSRVRAAVWALAVLPLAASAAELRCEAVAPIFGPYPLHGAVMSTPLVFEMAAPDAPGRREGVIAALFALADGTYYEEGSAVLRILRAEDCSERAVLGGVDQWKQGVWLQGSLNPAAADLDGDGAPEIIVGAADGSTLAFTSKDGNWLQQPLWRTGPAYGFPCSHVCPRWGGISVHDLDDDGAPEVIREGTVFSSTGEFLAQAPTGYGEGGAFSLGSFPLVANLDADPAIELSDGRRTWEWHSADGIGQWVEDTAFVSAAAGAGHVAVADLFPEPGEADAVPEYVVVRMGSVELLDSTGASKGQVALPGGGNGSPPAIADFDGDGWPEVGANGGANLILLDPDCGTDPRPGGSCPSQPCTGDCEQGIAWARPVQDIASNRTPPIAFDFHGDGASELVFADECYLRAFDASGSVVLSHFHRSCTWMESPVVAAVDASRRAALVLPSNTACSTITCPLLDPIYPGQTCSGDADCVSGACDQGLCRCSSSAECCSAGDAAICEARGASCAEPPPLTPGTGNTCRSSWPAARTGIAVFADPRWTTTRPIWNQAAYTVSNINDDGSVPRSSEWHRHWLAPGLGHRANPSLGPPVPEVFADGFEQSP